MKKNIISFITFVFILIGVLGCGERVKAIKLDTPYGLYVYNHKLVFNHVTYATSYVIWANHEEYIVYDNSFDLSTLPPNEYTFKVKAKGNKKTYIDSSFSKPIEYIFPRNDYLYVTFDANGGTKVDDLKYVEKSTKIKEPTTTKTGHIFLGWFLGEYEWNFNYDIVTSDITLIALWQPITGIKISLYNDSQIFATITVNYFDKYPVLPTPYKSGHVFLGWYTEDNKKIVAGNTVTLTENCKVYAKYTDQTVYELTFHSRGGSEVDSIFVEHGTKYGKLPIPVREGFTFGGWQTSDFTIISENMIVLITKDTNLYAIWAEEKKVRIEFDDPNLKYITRNINDLYGPLPTPTPKGSEYTFLGWYTENDIKVSDETKVVNPQNHTLFPRWKSDEIVRIDFPTTDLESITRNYGDTYGGLPVYELLFQHFIGWQDENGNMIYSHQIIQQHGPIRLYPILDEMEDTIYLDPDGGSCSIKYIKRTEFSQSITAYKLGYEFVGWFTEWYLYYEENLIMPLDTSSQPNFILKARYVKTVDNISYEDQTITWEGNNVFTSYLVNVNGQEFSAFTKSFSMYFIKDTLYDIKISFSYDYTTTSFSTKTFVSKEVSYQFIDFTEITDLKYLVGVNEVSFTWGQGSYNSTLLNKNEKIYYQIKCGNIYVPFYEYNEYVIPFAAFQTGESKFEVKRVTKLDTNNFNGEASVLCLKPVTPTFTVERSIVYVNQCSVTGKTLLTAFNYSKVERTYIDFNNYESTRETVSAHNIGDASRGVPIPVLGYKDFRRETITGITIEQMVLKLSFGSFRVTINGKEYYPSERTMDLKEFIPKEDYLELEIIVVKLSTNQDYLESHPLVFKIPRLERSNLNFDVNTHYLSFDVLPDSSYYTLFVNDEQVNYLIDNNVGYYHVDIYSCNEQLKVELIGYSNELLPSLKESLNVKIYTLTFNSMQGSSVNPIRVFEGAIINPPNSIRPSYKLKGWTTDITTKVLFDFKSPITSNLTFYAVWSLDIVFNYQEVDGGYLIGMQDVYIYGVLSIPQTYNGLDIIGIMDNGFRDCIYITELVLPDTIKIIGSYAFYNCETLTKINLSRVEVISEFAFYNCSFNNVYIPKTVKIIGEKAFSNCFDVTIYFESNIVPFTDFTESDLIYSNVLSYHENNSIKYIIKNNNRVSIIKYLSRATEYVVSEEIEGLIIDEIGYKAFYNTNVTKVTLSNNINIISDYSFYDCNSLKVINFPYDLISIGAYAFYNTKLETVSLPVGILRIGNYAFYGCEFLQTFSLPSSVVFIGTYAIYNNMPGVIYTDALERKTNWDKSFTNYFVHYQYVGFQSNEEYEYEEFFDFVIITKCKITNKQIIVPQTINGKPVLEIASYAFTSYAINAIIISEGIEIIRANAFYEMAYLYLLQLPKSLKLLESDAVYKCNRLAGLYIGKDTITSPNSINTSSYIFIYTNSSDFCFDEKFVHSEYLMTYDIENVFLVGTKVYGMHKNGVEILIFDLATIL